MEPLEADLIFIAEMVLLETHLLLGLIQQAAYIIQQAIMELHILIIKFRILFGVFVQSSQEHLVQTIMRLLAVIMVFI